MDGVVLLSFQLCQVNTINHCLFPLAIIYSIYFEVTLVKSRPVKLVCVGGEFFKDALHSFKVKF